MLEWKHLQALEELDAIRDASFSEPIVVLKHSTRCSISAMALGRLQRNFKPVNAQFYYLDILKYRPISNAIAEEFQVHHESPQILLIVNGECVYEASHMEIEFEELASEILSHSPAA